MHLLASFSSLVLPYHVAFMTNCFRMSYLFPSRLLLKSLKYYQCSVTLVGQSLATKQLNFTVEFEAQSHEQIGLSRGYGSDCLDHHFVNVRSQIAGVKLHTLSWLNKMMFFLQSMSFSCLSRISLIFGLITRSILCLVLGALALEFRLCNSPNKGKVEQAKSRVKHCYHLQLLSFDPELLLSTN